MPKRTRTTANPTATKKSKTSSSFVTLYGCVKRPTPVDPQGLVVKVEPLGTEGRHVFQEELESKGLLIWDCLLNQTNINRNNNKYYVIQLQKDNKANKYSLFTRWGRVGNVGQMANQAFGKDLQKAKSAFCSKFKSKTGNIWNSAEYVFQSGKYELVERDYSADSSKVDENSTDAKEEKLVKPEPECTLHVRVQKLLMLITDKDSFALSLTSMDFDVKRAPLGSVTSAQLKQGYEALRAIEDIIKDEGYHRNELVMACNAFYTRIPHAFGMRQPPLITSLEMINVKVELLQTLGDIGVAMNILEKEDVNENSVEKLSRLDRILKAIDINLNYLDPETTESQLVREYVLTTKGPTHSGLEVLEVFEVSKPVDFLDHGNNVLLFHGSPLPNWAGILKQGLRIAPPEAPSTGSMFGKGVYFADCSTKSANYCHTYSHKNEGILILCQVSLGMQRELSDADYEANLLPKGYHSVMGIGKRAADHKTAKKLEDGTVIPIGPLREKKKSGLGTLLYNEFIVYNTRQIRMRYLVRFKSSELV